MQADFLFIFFIFQNTDEATFFKSEKRQMRGIWNRWGRAWERINFFSYLIEV